MLKGRFKLKGPLNHHLMFNFGDKSQYLGEFHEILLTALVGIQYYGMNCRQKKKQHVLNFSSSACSSYHYI